MKKFEIKKLSFDTLQSAENLRDKYFKNIPKNEKDTLKASLDKTKYAKYLLANNIDNISYWCIKEQNEVIGLIGLYTEVDFPNKAWIGWFVVDENFRDKKLGKMLLEYIIKEASSFANEICLYSWDDEPYHKAIKLYENYGFQRYIPDFKIYKKDIYMKKNL